MYTLYYSPGAASMLVHWLLLELEQLHELRLVDTGKGEQKSPQYLALNPNGGADVVIDGIRCPRPRRSPALVDKHADANLAPDTGSDARVRTRNGCSISPIRANRCSGNGGIRTNRPATPTAS